MQRVFLPLVMATCFFSATSIVWAGDSVGLVEMILVNRSDVVIFAAGTHNNKPAESTMGDEWAFSLTTEAGKSMYSLLLSAAAQGQVVHVVGENACVDWGDRETPKRIWVEY